jgi:LPS export ABC transporter protein LptC
MVFKTKIKICQPSLSYQRGRLIFFAAIGGWLLSACEISADKAKDLAEKQNKILIETGTGVEMLYTKDAKPHIRIKAKTAVRYEVENPYMEFTEGMELTIYDDEGNVESILTANYGKMADNSSELEAKDDVVVINKDQEQLNTEHLIWDKENAVIKSDAFVKITTKDEILFGNGFISDDKFTDYTIFNITGTVKIKDDF